jgi:fructose-1,6-bisphosphatase
MVSVTVTVITDPTSHSFYRHGMSYGTKLQEATALVKAVYNVYGQEVPLSIPVRRDITVFTYRPTSHLA